MLVKIVTFQWNKMNSETLLSMKSGVLGLILVVMAACSAPEKLSESKKSVLMRTYSLMRLGFLYFYKGAVFSQTLMLADSKADSVRLSGSNFSLSGHELFRVSSIGALSMFLNYTFVCIFGIRLDEAREEAGTTTSSKTTSSGSTPIDFEVLASARL